MARQEIPKHLIPLAYRVSKDVNDKTLKLSEGVKELCKNGQMNEGSAKDYIYAFRYMLLGRRFTRTLNTSSMDFFLANIKEDFEPVYFSKALVSLQGHIAYYEGIQDATMHQMRILVDKYKQFVPAPNEIFLIEHLKHNLKTLEDYLTSSEVEKRVIAQRLIKGGVCLLAYTVDNEIRFAPSRYLGYQDNEPYKYLLDIDGRITNKIITSLIGIPEEKDSKMDLLYIDYCEKLGIQINHKNGIPAKPRKYWKLELSEDFSINEEVSDGFPEGRIVERMHKARERSSKVIELAKTKFKLKHGKLFCQVCKFDYKDAYGKIGDGFIEGHHTIAIKDMPADYKTKPEEIALLCANCHRMAHRKRPWLTMDKLNNLITK